MDSCYLRNRFIFYLTVLSLYLDSTSTWLICRYYSAIDILDIKTATMILMDCVDDLVSDFNILNFDLLTYLQLIKKQPKKQSFTKILNFNNLKDSTKQKHKIQIFIQQYQQYSSYYQHNNTNMYITPQSTIPNYFQLDQLPYLRMDVLNMESNVSSKRMLAVRNLTYKYENVLCKIFVFWPKLSRSSQNQQMHSIKLMVFNELPILSLQSLTYLLNELKQKDGLSSQEWSNSISKIQKFKQESNKIIEQILMVEHQIKLTNLKNLTYFVYFCPKEKEFLIKIGFRILGFQVSPFLKKNSNSNINVQQKFVISNQKVKAKLYEKMHQKLLYCYKNQYDEWVLQKFKEKYIKFYSEELKVVDQFLLQLKLSQNYPLLRSKHFLPIQFTDRLTGEPLSSPIISNKNKHCMYAHFIGYNSSTLQKLHEQQPAYCEICGIEIKQMQQNLLLMFLRQNLCNPRAERILYLPEFNRWKIWGKIPESERLQRVKRSLQKLKISNEHQDKIKDSETAMYDNKQKNISSEIDEQNIVNNQMKNEQQEQQNEDLQAEPQAQIKYINYMHLCLSLKNFYSLTKTRIKIQPLKQIQHIYFVYSYQNSTNKNNEIGLKKSKGSSTQTAQTNSKDLSNIDRYWKQFELTDPARGKFCNHLEFADLRLYYRNRLKKVRFNTEQTVFICPICQSEVKDNELIYLKQVVVLLKFIKKLLQKQSQSELEMNETNNKARRADKNTIRIIINNVQQRVLVDYTTENTDGTQLRKQWREIDKLYPTLIDPYIHFSQYSLGLQKKSKRFDMFEQDGRGQDSGSQKFEKEWYGLSSNTFSV